MEDSSLISWHFHITGQVQGIGFRPHVFRIAKDLNIKGWVSNDIDGVHIEFTSTQILADLFTSKILKTAPILSRISSSQLQQIPFKHYDGFKITQKETATASRSSITADFALCIECRNEIRQSRRKDYPFISCTRCGPRYSILEKLPFDREHTSMNKFLMCDICKAEYTNPLDRRFHAQTNSCFTCQISQQLYTKDTNLVSSDTTELLSLIPQLWAEGKIIAIKGIGGFVLTCDAQNKTAVKELRLRKNRPAKPFAVMLPSLEYYPTLNQVPSIKETLHDHVSPIVLCPKNQISDKFDFVADGLDKVGIMIPYAPIFQILLQSYNRPIIATSGNVSNSPIIFENKIALNHLSSIADFILVNDRDIVIPQDDSVVTFTSQSNQKIILRRSRGLAPNYFEAYQTEKNDSILCLGAEMKSTFCISHFNDIYISQYIGNLNNFETQNHFNYLLKQFLNLIHLRPTHICVDSHPEYYTHKEASALSEKFNAPILKIQHHKAHFASILGEHKLLDSTEKILGVVWDGTGFGDDGMIWGGEFFVYKDYTMSRCSHLEYYDHFLQNKMALEPRLSAFAILHADEKGKVILQEKFTSEEWRVYNVLIGKENLLKTSSMGRLFDAAASILGLLDKQTFEGEAAMRLEVAARQYISKHDIKELNSYLIKDDSIQHIQAKHILLQMIEDIDAQKTNEEIAAKFHLTLVEWILVIADTEGCSSLAFSGGVFQNSVLVDLIYAICGDELSLYFHNNLSPNDENISFGQYIYFKMAYKLTEKN